MRRATPIRSLKWRTACRAAADGAEAWQLIERHDIPLVITDWMMPTLDGPGLIQRIRAAKLPTYTYVILLTVRGARNDVVAGLEAHYRAG